MKIISKHKDYYDYLVGIYGIDEKMVYNRRTNALEKPLEDIVSTINQSSVTTHTFSICNRIYVIFQFENVFYHTLDEYIELYRILEKKKLYTGFLWHSWGDIEEGIGKKYKELNCASEVNKIVRQPVLIQTTYEENSFKYQSILSRKYFYDSNEKTPSYWRIPELSKYGFAKWVPADEMYQQIVAFIGWMVDYPEIPNKQTNVEKIQSNGFDVKTSFRHRK